MIYKLRPANGTYYLLLLVFGLVVYWPLSLNLFSLKNDATTYFLPFRYHVSESIRHGYFPFWSPYLYTGHPLHADIQSGVWNPVVMVVSLFTTYNMTVLEWEMLFYLIAAGIGFFKLGRQFGFEKPVCLVLSMCYMCCGFFIDSTAIIPWVTSAAWLPFMLAYFYRSLQAPTLLTSVKLGFFASLLFLAGYSSFFIFSAWLLLFLLAVQLVSLVRKARKKEAWLLLKHLMVAGLCALLICSPALISYLEFFPYYTRGKGLSLHMAQFNPFGLKNTVSYLLPAASYKISAGSDIISRNATIGIVPLVFLAYLLRGRWHAVQTMIIGLVVFTFLFSLGDGSFVRGFFYRFVPFMDTFRHPGAIRIFTSIGLLLLSGYGCSRYLHGDRAFFRKTIWALAAIVLLLICIPLFYSGTISAISTTTSSLKPDSQSLKLLIDRSGYPFWALVAGAFQLACLMALQFIKNTRGLYALVAVNLFVMSTASFPFTTVSQYRTKEVNRFLASFPPGFPPAEAWKPVENTINDPARFSRFGYLEFYTKRIAIQDLLVHPTVTAAYDEMLRDSTLRDSISRHPFAYSAAGDPVQLLKFSPNAFSFRTSISGAGLLHITQQYHHNWQAKVNGRRVEIRRDHHSFMAIELADGSNVIELVYRSPLITAAAIMALILFVGCIVLFIYSRIKV